MKRTRQSGSLARVLSLAFAGLSAASLALAGASQLAAAARAQRDIVSGAQRLVAQDAARAVSDFLQARLRTLQTSVRISDPFLASPEGQSLLLDSLLGLDRSFRTLMLLDHRDQVLVLASRQSRAIASKLALRIAADILARTRQGDPVLGEAYVDDFTGEPLMVIAVPVADSLGDFEGTLAAEVNLKFMWDLVGALEVGATGSAYVVDRRGNLLAFDDAARVLQGENVGDLRAVADFMGSPPDAPFAGVRSYRGITDSVVLGAYVPLGTPDWAVVTEIPLGEAYAEVYREGLVSGAITLCMAALAALTGMLLARRLALPLVDLTETADRISRGETSLEAAEHGPREAARLAVAFNSMTRRLRQTLDGLEQTVAERTAQVREALAFQQEIVKASSIGIVVYDRTGTCVLANDAASRMAGMPTEGLVGGDRGDIASWGGPLLGEAAGRALSSGQETELEAHLSGPGKDAWLSCRFIPFSSAGADHLLVTMHDMTERVRAETEIRDLNTALERHAEDLSAANKELEAFTYSVSHDLRAPLRAISGYARILVEDHGPRLGEEGRRMCDVIAEQAGRMGQLIEDLLSLSRLGRQPIRAEPIDMDGLVRSAFEEVVPPDTRAGVQLSVGALPPAAGDARLVRQVWANLISNAVKFSSGVEHPLIQIAGGADGGQRVYSIRDNGAGFDMRYADKLFGVFQRLHAQEQFSGTGVGLAIVQRIIHRHGGRVWAEGRVGEGAVFSFTLPPV